MKASYRIEWTFKPNKNGGVWRSGEWTIFSDLSGKSLRDSRWALREVRRPYSAAVHDCFRLVSVTTTKRVIDA